jgi:hypothetical protein
MDRLCMIMDLATLCIPCIAFMIVSYVHNCDRPRGARTRGNTGASTNRGC